MCFEQELLPFWGENSKANWVVCWKIYAVIQEFYMTAGRSGRAKYQLCTQLWKVSQDNFNRTSIDIVFLVCSSSLPAPPREKPVVSWFVKGYKHKCRRSYFIQDLDLLVFEARFSSEIDIIFKLYSNYKTCSIKHKLVLLIESNLLNPFGIVRYPHKNIRTVSEKVRFLVF